MSYTYTGILSIAGGSKNDREQAYCDLFEYFNDDNHTEEFTSSDPISDESSLKQVITIVFSVEGQTFQEELLEYSKKKPSLSFLYEVLSIERDFLGFLLCKNGNNYVKNIFKLHKFIPVYTDEQIENMEEFIEDQVIYIMRAFTNYYFKKKDPKPSKEAFNVLNLFISFSS